MNLTWLKKRSWSAGAQEQSLAALRPRRDWYVLWLTTVGLLLGLIISHQVWRWFLERRLDQAAAATLVSAPLEIADLTALTRTLTERAARFQSLLTAPPAVTPPR